MQDDVYHQLDEALAKVDLLLTQRNNLLAQLDEAVRLLVVWPNCSHKDVQAFLARVKGGQS